jgi:tetratricopeptide (TPR) repeat protein
MKTLYAIIISLFFLSPCFSQQDLLPAFPREIRGAGTNEDIAYFIPENRPFTGIVVDEKTKRKLGEYANGYRNGIFTEYYPNGKKRSEGKYINGVKNGDHIEWYENGNKKVLTTYMDGKQNGAASEWLANGQKVIPPSPLELSEKADTAYAAGLFDEAEPLYTAVLRAVPDDPLATKRLKEITVRRQQAEKLKNADFFLTRGDDAYRTGDFSLAASYYSKISEVDESYHDAGAKYWLSKARAAKAIGDQTSLREAKVKLKRMVLPESLQADQAELCPASDQSIAADSMSLEDLIDVIECGNTVLFKIKAYNYSSASSFWGGMWDGRGGGSLEGGTVTVSKRAVAFRTADDDNSFSESPSEIMTVSNQQNMCVNTDIRVKKGKGERETKLFHFCHVNTYMNGEAVRCDVCDNSSQMKSLQMLLDKVHAMPKEAHTSANIPAAQSGKKEPNYAKTQETNSEQPPMRTYEEWNLAKLVMLKPAGNYIRVTARWLGPSSNEVDAPDGYFTGLLMDPKSAGAIYFLWIPKSLADDVSNISSNSMITVEGLAQKRGNGKIAGILVHRFVGIAGKPTL